ncbi:MAG TPA: hypothetical protein VGQ65_02590 [Thermoanaerobaculia bacterium]|nr:hypothetical protein [Thermoanaerobaculia bacterium]
MRAVTTSGIGAHTTECRDHQDPFVLVMRRLFAAVAVLMLSGLLMLAAGLCGGKACCHSQAPGSAASLDTNPPCCDETNCDTTLSVDATAAKTAIVQPPQVAAITVAVQPLLLQSTSPRPRIQSGPLGTRQKLATRSILLI